MVEQLFLLTLYIYIYIEPADKLVATCREHRIALSGPLTVPRILDKLISHFIEPECVQPTFLYNHPIALSPLAKGTIDENVRII